MSQFQVSGTFWLKPAKVATLSGYAKPTGNETLREPLAPESLRAPRGRILRICPRIDDLGKGRPIGPGKASFLDGRAFGCYSPAHRNDGPGLNRREW
jgi:hypothetical protein